jgi:hypothetical protein
VFHRKRKHGPDNKECIFFFGGGPYVTTRRDSVDTLSRCVMFRQMRKDVVNASPQPQTETKRCVAILTYDLLQ